MGRLFFSLIIYFCILFSASKILKPVVEKEKNNKNNYIKLQEVKPILKTKLSKKVEKVREKSELRPMKVKKIRIRKKSNSHKSPFCQQNAQPLEVMSVEKTISHKNEMTHNISGEEIECY